MVMTLGFGIWLAISLDAYHPWDGWIIAAIVLWAVAGGTGARGLDLLAWLVAVWAMAGKPD
jgi:hypothetical protein